MSIYYVEDVDDSEPDNFQEEYEQFLDRQEIRAEIKLDDDLED